MRQQKVRVTEKYTHYGIAKYLSQLLHPLTINEHTIKDTFGAKTRIETIDQSYFKEGFKYVSFDVESLFTNVRQHRTKGNIHANTVYLFVIDDRRSRSNVLIGYYIAYVAVI